MIEIDDRKPSPNWETYLENKSHTWGLSNEQIENLRQREHAYLAEIKAISAPPQLLTYEQASMYAYESIKAKNNDRFICNQEDARVYRLICQYFTRHPDFEKSEMSNGKLGNLDRPLYLCGEVGTGKSTLMRLFPAIIGRYCFHNGYSIAVTAQDMVDDFNNKERGGNDALKRYINAIVLYIDDLGREQDAAHFSNKSNPIEYVLSKRYDKWEADKSRVTHISTNMVNAKKVEDLYGDYIRDRFKLYNKILWNTDSKRN